MEGVSGVEEVEVQMYDDFVVPESAEDACSALEEVGRCAAPSVQQRCGLPGLAMMYQGLNTHQGCPSEIAMPQLAGCTEAQLLSFKKCIVDSAPVDPDSFAPIVLFSSQQRLQVSSLHASFSLCPSKAKLNSTGFLLWCGWRGKRTCRADAVHGPAGCWMQAPLPPSPLQLLPNDMPRQGLSLKLIRHTREEYPLPMPSSWL